RLLQRPAQPDAAARGARLRTDRAARLLGALRALHEPPQHTLAPVAPARGGTRVLLRHARERWMRSPRLPDFGRRRQAARTRHLVGRPDQAPARVDRTAPRVSSPRPGGALRARGANAASHPRLTRRGTEVRGRRALTMPTCPER